MGDATGERQVRQSGQCGAMARYRVQATLSTPDTAPGN